MTRRSALLLSIVAAIAIAGCSTAPVVEPVPPGVTVECGPVREASLCQQAVAVALAAKINPPPAVAVRIRLPAADDECQEWLPPCGDGTVVAEIQSGDTIQTVPLFRLDSGGWTRLELMR